MELCIYLSIIPYWYYIYYEYYNWGQVSNFSTGHSIIHSTRPLCPLQKNMPANRLLQVKPLPINNHESEIMKSAVHNAVDDVQMEDRFRASASPTLSDSSDMLLYDPPKTSSISPSITTTALQSRSQSPMDPMANGQHQQQQQLWHHSSSIKSGGSLAAVREHVPAVTSLAVSKAGSGLRRTDTGESMISLAESSCSTNDDAVIQRMPRSRKALRPIRAPKAKSSVHTTNAASVYNTHKNDENANNNDDENKENVNPAFNGKSGASSARAAMVEAVVFKFVVTESATTRIQLTNRPEDLLSRCISRRRAARLNGEPLAGKRTYPFAFDAPMRKRRSRSVVSSGGRPIFDGDADDEMKPFPVTEPFYQDFAKDALNLTLPLNYNPLQSLAATTRRIGVVCRYQVEQGATEFELPYYGEEEFEEDEDDDDELSDSFSPKVKQKKKVVKPKRTRSKEAKIHAEKFCASCKTNQTPIWREVKESWGDAWQEIMLCNACGLQWRMAGLRCSHCQYVPRASEKKSKKCTKCDTGVWYRK